MTSILVDENLPHGLQLPTGLPVTHATEPGPSPTDSALWAYATDHRCVILTKDTDFSDRMLLQEPPPWVVWCRVGNLRRQAFIDLVHRTWPQIERLLRQHRMVTLTGDALFALD